MDNEQEALARGRSRVGLFPRVLWTACTEWEGEGGRRGGAFEGLEPGFLLSGTVCFSKAYLKRFHKHGLLSRF